MKRALGILNGKAHKASNSYGYGLAGPFENYSENPEPELLNPKAYPKASTPKPLNPLTLNAKPLNHP